MEYRKSYVIFLKMLPKIIAILAGVVVFVISHVCGELWQSLLINIASSLIAIPLIIIFYDLWVSHSNKKLNKSVYDYAKNEVSEVFYNCKQKIENLESGIGYLFNNLEFDQDFIIEDKSDKDWYIKLDEKSKIKIDEEDGEKYIEKYMIDEEEQENTDEEEQESTAKEKQEIADKNAKQKEKLENIKKISEILAKKLKINKKSKKYQDLLDRSSFTSDLFCQQFLGTQVFALDFEIYIKKIRELIANSFVMNRLEDKAKTVIVDMYNNLRVVQNFIDDCDIDQDIFAEVVSLKVHGLKSIKKEGIGKSCLYSIDFVDGEYSQTLDCILIEKAKKSKLCKPYMLTQNKQSRHFVDNLYVLKCIIEEWEKLTDGAIIYDEF